MRGEGTGKFSMKQMLLATAGAAMLTAGTARADDRGPGLLYDALGAPDGWTISGSVRARIEGIEGQYRPKVDGHDRMLSFRTDLFVERDTGPVRIGAEFADSRSYLERKNSSVSVSDVNAMEFIQAYLGVDFGAALGKGTASTLTVGRFTQNIGSQRLVAKNEQFPNVENTITGASFDWNNAAHDNLRLFWGMPTTRLPSDSDSLHHNRIQWDRQSLDTQFFGGAFSKAGVFGGTAELYGYGLIERDSPELATRNRHLFTPGIRFSRKPKRGAVDYDVEGIYQTGHARATTAVSDRRDLSVSAFLVHASIGRTFAGAWTPRLSVSFDHASGDRRNPDTYNRFDSLYSSRRFELAPTGLYGAVNRANFTSPEIRLEAVPSKRIDTMVAYRPVWLDTVDDGFSGLDIHDTSGAHGRFAGNQIEGRVRYWLVPKLVRLDTGLVYLAKSRLLRDAPNIADRSDTRYGYADITFCF
jgi:hypothetical protein